MIGTNKKFLVAFCTLLASLVFLSGSQIRAVLGQIVALQVRVDGLELPSGASLLDGSLVETLQTPATIHLVSGQMVRLEPFSQASFQQREGGIHLEVLAGLVTVEAEGGPLTLPPQSRLLLPAAGTGQLLTPSLPGLVAVLLAAVSPGQTQIIVNDVSRIDPQERVLVRSLQGDREEIHCVRNLKRSTVAFYAPVSHPFESQALLLQGPEVEKAERRGVQVLCTAAAAAAAAGAAGALPIWVPLSAAGSVGAAAAAVAATQEATVVSPVKNDR